jgi:hypothetical protein
MDGKNKPQKTQKTRQEGSEWNGRGKHQTKGEKSNSAGLCVSSGYKRKRTGGGGKMAAGSSGRNEGRQQEREDRPKRAVRADGRAKKTGGAVLFDRGREEHETKRKTQTRKKDSRHKHTASRGVGRGKKKTGGEKRAESNPSPHPTSDTTAQHKKRSCRRWSGNERDHTRTPNAPFFFFFLARGTEVKKQKKQKHTRTEK